MNPNNNGTCNSDQNLNLTNDVLIDATPSEGLGFTGEPNNSKNKPNRSEKRARIPAVSAARPVKSPSALGSLRPIVSRGRDGSLDLDLDLDWDWDWDLDWD